LRRFKGDSSKGGKGWNTGESKFLSGVQDTREEKGRGAEQKKKVGNERTLWVFFCLVAIVVEAVMNFMLRTISLPKAKSGAKTRILLRAKDPMGGEATIEREGVGITNDRSRGGGAEEFRRPQKVKSKPRTPGHPGTGKKGVTRWKGEKLVTQCGL